MVWDIVGDGGRAPQRPWGSRAMAQQDGASGRAATRGQAGQPGTCAWRSVTPLLFCHGPGEATGYELRAKLSDLSPESGPSLTCARH